MYSKLFHALLLKPGYTPASWASRLKDRLKPFINSLSTLKMLKMSVVIIILLHRRRNKAKLDDYHSHWSETVLRCSKRGAPCEVGPFLAHHSVFLGLGWRIITINLLPLQPSGSSLLKFQNPALHRSHLDPSTFVLQIHRPASNPASGSFLPSHSPPLTPPTESQLQAIRKKR